MWSEEGKRLKGWLMKCYYFVFLISPFALALETLHISPGQCIWVGQQQVCALPLNQDNNPPPDIINKPKTKEPKAEKSQIIYVCRYEKSETDQTSLKNYALYQIIIKPDGSKTETQLKIFGVFSSDKKNCEREAEKKSPK